MHAYLDVDGKRQEVLSFAHILPHQFPEGRAFDMLHNDCLTPVDASDAEDLGNGKAACISDSLLVCFIFGFPVGRPGAKQFDDFPVIKIDIG